MKTVFIYEQNRQHHEPIRTHSSDGARLENAEQPNPDTESVSNRKRQYRQVHSRETDVPSAKGMGLRMRGTEASTHKIPLLGRLYTKIAIGYQSVELMRPRGGSIE